VSVEGTTAAGFKPVRDAVARALEAQEAGGMAVAAIIDGKLVVDLWAEQVGLTRSSTPGRRSSRWLEHACCC
jgi:hypothetical protein